MMIEQLQAMTEDDYNILGLVILPNEEDDGRVPCEVMVNAPNHVDGIDLLIEILLTLKLHMMTGVEPTHSQHPTRI